VVYRNSSGALRPAIILENVYNIDKTSVLLSVLNSLKVLVSKQDLTNYRGTIVKRTLVTNVSLPTGNPYPTNYLAYFYTSEHLNYAPNS